MWLIVCFKVEINVKVIWYKLNKIREFYQVFNICAVHVYESTKMIGDTI